MVRMQVHKVGLDPRRLPFVLLVDEDHRRMLPIWVGPFEANAIAAELRGDAFPRPLTHDLLRNVIETLGYELAQVSVTRLQESTYYALLHLKGPAGALEIDCRPSDAIALALRTDAPIYVAEEVLQEGEVDEEIERFKGLLGGLDEQLGESDLGPPPEEQA